MGLWPWSWRWGRCSGRCKWGVVLVLVLVLVLGGCRVVMWTVRWYGEEEAVGRVLGAGW